MHHSTKTAPVAYRGTWFINHSGTWFRKYPKIQAQVQIDVDLTLHFNIVVSPDAGYIISPNTFALQATKQYCVGGEMLEWTSSIKHLDDIISQRMRFLLTDC